MRAVDQWRELEQGLPSGWDEAQLIFAVEDPSAVAAAAVVLAPLGPGRVGNELRFHARPLGPNSAESVRNLLQRLDRKRIWGTLGLVEVAAVVPVAELLAEGAGERPAGSLVAAWERLLETLPPDWSDVLCELEVDSSDFLPRAALLGAPLNPMRVPDALALRFRVGRKGYGTSPIMARRCFERMDEESITGRLEVVDALSDVGNVGTQGPVWRVAGRSV
jgi:hypothetical protein